MKYLQRKNSSSLNKKFTGEGMKKEYKVIVWTSLLFFLACAISLTAIAQSKQEVAKSMRDRHSALIEAKDKGLVGEAWTGLAGLVKPDAPDGVQSLVEAENNDRKELFKIIAGETGTSVQEVARQNRIRMYRLAKDQHFVQDANRSWVQKKDLSQ